ncbi:MAG: FdhD protein, partial [Bradyrhizobium sp.]|nr:FdhD protein [Bradyrhizobium sp.]
MLGKESLSAGRPPPSPRHLKSAAPGHIVPAMASRSDDYLLRPDPAARRLTARLRGFDQTGAAVETAVTVERALSIFLNAQ